MLCLHSLAGEGPGRCHPYGRGCGCFQGDGKAGLALTCSQGTCGTWETLENPGDGEAGLCRRGRGEASLCLSLDVSRKPGPGVQMRSSIGRAWAPAPQGPWSEQLRMDALLDSMWRGHSEPGWAGRRACGPDPVSTWKRSHTNTQDPCPGLSRWSGLARAPSERPPVGLGTQPLPWAR